MAASHTRRSVGEGAVYRTAEGRWRGRAVLVHPVTGDKHRRYVSGPTKAEVVRRLQVIQRESATGAYPSGETLGEFLTRWLVAVQPRLRPATFGGYSQHVRDYWAALSVVQLTKLTPSDVERQMAKLMDRGLSPLTVLHARSTLRRALHDAERDGLVVRNAAGLARPPRAERREMRALSPADVHMLLDATADDVYGPIYGLALGSGLRLGEILGLQWSDIDLRSALLTVRRSMALDSAGGWSLSPTKTAKSRRTVMLPAIALDALRKQQERQLAAKQAAGRSWQNTLELVFTDMTVGLPLSSPEPSRAFRIAADRLGLKDCHFHSLRHSSASLMLSAGVPLKVVSEALGHTTVAVTGDIYSHVSPELRREAASGIDKMLARGVR